MSVNTIVIEVTKASVPSTIILNKGAPIGAVRYTDLLDQTDVDLPTVNEPLATHIATLGTASVTDASQTVPTPAAPDPGDTWFDPDTGRKYEYNDGVFVEVSAGGPLPAEPAAPDPAYLTPDGGNIRTADGGLVLTSGPTDLTPEPDIQNFLAASTNAEARESLEIPVMPTITVTRQFLNIHTATVFLTDDPNGNYAFDATTWIYTKGDFTIHRELVGSTTTWHFELRGVPVASRVSASPIGEWTVSNPDFGTTFMCRLGDVETVIESTDSNATLLINEAAVGDVITLAAGEFTYNGLPYIAGTPDAVGNHRDHAPELTIQSISRRASTLKLVQIAQDINVYLNVYCFRSYARISLINLVIDVNAYENITNFEVGWVWGGTNLNLNPRYGAFSLYGRDSLVKGCRSIGWTAGGTNVPTSETATPEHFPHTLSGLDSLVEDCLFEEPTSVHLTRPYGTYVTLTTNCTARDCAVILPTTADNFWATGAVDGQPYCPTFAFGPGEGTTFENCYAENCGKAFHRDTLPLTGCALRGCSCKTCVRGADFQITGPRLCRGLSFVDSRFDVIHSHDKTNKGVGIKVVSNETPIDGVICENNIVTAPDTAAFSILIGSLGTELSKNLILRNNISGVITTEEIDGTDDSAIRGELFTQIDTEQVDSKNFDSAAREVGRGGTGSDTKQRAITNLGLDKFVPPTKDPLLYGALWNNEGVLSFSPAVAETTTYVSAVEAALGGSIDATVYAFIDRFIRNEKTTGRWVQHKALFFPIWGVMEANMINMINPSEVAIATGPLHHEFGYIKGDNTMAYINTDISLQEYGIDNTSITMWAACLGEQTSQPAVLMGSGSGDFSVFFEEVSPSYLHGQLTDQSTISVHSGEKGLMSYTYESGVARITRRNGYTNTVLVSNEIENIAVTANSRFFFMARNNTTSPTALGPSNWSNGKFGGFGLSKGFAPSEEAAFTSAFKDLFESVTGLAII